VFGLTAIRYAVAGNVNAAVLLIALAADAGRAWTAGLPGCCAAKAPSAPNSIQLCDFVNFGVVPALVLYLWGLRGEMAFGWIAVLVYAVCCMLRLARFNVGSRQPPIPDEKTTFTGVPSPAGALLALMPVYVAQVTGLHLPEELIALWMVAVGGMMISRLRTPSLKRATIAASSAPFVLVGAVAAVAAVITYPWATLLLISAAYLAGVIWIALRRLRRGAA
jgi:CDP-diacylglycerol--serine O-phosphatidyltransferase